MSYSSLEACLLDLERHNQLVRIKEEVDADLEMAAIHLRVYEAGGPALLFENIRGCHYRATSNIFGTLDRSRFIFRDALKDVKQLIALKTNPALVWRDPLQHLHTGYAALHALPWRNPLRKPVTAHQIKLGDLPAIRHWPRDGGAFITLPQVFSEDPERPGIMHANLGMYRIQLNGNDYISGQEVGLHYQLHRGIGVHQHKATQQGQPLKVSVFIGGPPAHTLAAVMPLPEGMSELTFAGLLGLRRFRYTVEDGYYISTDADFVICGEVHPGVKPEGPFGDHLGYYSLTHDFPVMQVKKVFARDRAIWPFTVVGRPPQEDTSFGALIHELTGAAISAEIPGLKAVHAVDAAGVHPLLLAIGSERYTPYAPPVKPAELLTIAHHMLGSGQLSLAKYLLIAADDTGRLSVHHIADFFRFVLERADWENDLHFQTQTTMDTLDYSGTGLNAGSKVIIAVCGAKRRSLAATTPAWIQHIKEWRNPRVVIPGILAVDAGSYTTHADTEAAIAQITAYWRPYADIQEAFPLIVLCDDSAFTAASLDNFLWVSFTRSNPAHDIYGIDSFIRMKHWGCSGPLIIDARIKPHHAPPLEMDPAVVKKTERLFDKGGSLYGVLP